ncbi:MAG: calcium-binding protein [Actinomycetota bacterium]
MTIMHASLVAVLVTAAFVPGSVAPAQTGRASVRVVDGVLTYRDAPGRADSVFLTSTASSGETFDVDVASATVMHAGAGCMRVGAYRVTCSGVVSAAIFLGGGNDTLGVDSGALRRVVQGGSGNDRLFGGYGHDVLRGGAGDDEVDAGVSDEAIVRGGPGQDFLGGSSGPDTLIGGDGGDGLIGRAGPDHLLGGRGNDLVVGFHAGNIGGTPSGPDTDVLEGGLGVDLLEGGPAADRLIGGPGSDSLDGGGGSDVFRADPGSDFINGGGSSGRDTVDYSRRVRPVNVTDDRIANDGVTGERDDVTVVKAVLGGSGDDSVSIDVLAPARLFGNDGNDTLSTAVGGAIFGGHGDDNLIASGASTIVRGEAGDDHLSTADGIPDIDSCGPGDDSVDADASDDVSANCEDVTVAP